MRCRYQNPRCFLPPDERFCAARQAGKKGCACDSDACAQHCRFVTPRDPEATYVYYAGRVCDQSTSSPHTPATASDAQPARPRGKGHFGYKSKSFNIVDDRLFTFWSLPGPFASAHCLPCDRREHGRNDHLQTIPGFRDLQRRFPHLNIAEVIGDAGEGHDGILVFVYQELQALRTIVPRRHSSDDDPLTCLSRGYDGQGNPLCLHGYLLLRQLALPTLFFLEKSHSTQASRQSPPTSAAYVSLIRQRYGSGSPTCCGIPRIRQLDNPVQPRYNHHLLRVGFDKAH
jgi:hypothetical protein